MALAAVARPRIGPRLLLTPSVVLSNNNCQAARKVKDLRKGHARPRSPLAESIRTGGAGRDARQREDDNDQQIAPQARPSPSRRHPGARLPPASARPACSRGRARSHIGRAQGAGLEGRRAAAALGRAGRHRPGLPARRRDHRRHPQGPRAARPRHHERRHRIQRRCGALPRRAADRRGRAAARRRLRLRPDARRSPRWPSRRASRSSSTSPPPRRSPSRATSSCSATSRPRR